MHTQQQHRLTRAALTTALALTATTASLSLTAAHAAERELPHNQQVALEDGTDAQAMRKSATSGTGQTASDDGRYVVFATLAPLVSTDTNEESDVYLRDTVLRTTTLVSTVDGTVGNDVSSDPTISADGRYVAFTTWADNLTYQDTNGHVLDVVVKDLEQGLIELASVTSEEEQRGRNSFAPTISDDGTAVSFQSFSPFGRLDEDRKEDVYVRDLVEGRTYQASISPRGKDIGGPMLNGDLSADGNRVVFGINDKLWMRDLEARRTVRFWHEPHQPPCQPVPGGSAGRPVISGDGRYAAFSSCAVELPGEDGAHSDIYRVNLETGKIVRMNPAGDGDSYLPSLSYTGRFLAFGSVATDLVEGDDEGNPDGFYLDMRSGEVTRVSEASDGAGGDSWSATNDIAISTDGSSVVYVSYAGNLVAGDAEDGREAFLWQARPTVP